MDESNGVMKDDDVEEVDTTPVSSEAVVEEDSCRSPGYGAAANLPDDSDIWEKIMSHLPASSLVLCREVCKRWGEIVRRPSTLRRWAEQNAPIDIWVPLSYTFGKTCSMILYNGRTRRWKVQAVQRRSVPGNKYCRLSRTSSHGLLIFTDAFKIRDDFNINREKPFRCPGIVVLNPISHAKKILPPLPNADAVVSICGAKFLDFEDANYGGSAYYKVLVISKCAVVHDEFASRVGDARRGKAEITSHVFISKTNEWRHIGGLRTYENADFHITSICQLQAQAHGEQTREPHSGEHISFHFECPENFTFHFGLERNVSLLGYDKENEMWIKWRIRGSSWLRNPEGLLGSYRLPGGFVQRNGELLVTIKEVDSEGKCVGVSIHSLSVQVEKSTEDQHWKFVSEMPPQLFTRFHNNRCACRNHPPHEHESRCKFTDCLKHIVCVADLALDQILFFGNCPFLVASYRFLGSGRGEWLDLQMPHERGSTQEHEDAFLGMIFRSSNMIGMNFGLQLRPDISP